MDAIRFDFRSGYHATVWGSEPCEGQIEWPPSPFRILRTLLAVGYRSMDWPERSPSPFATAILEKLATGLVYSVPGVGSPLTNFIYSNVGASLTKKDKPEGYYDAWVMPSGPLFVGLPALTPEEKAYLSKWVGRVLYLGRAESVCRASLVEFDCEWSDESQVDGSRPVDVLAVCGSDVMAVLNRKPWGSTPTGTRLARYWLRAVAPEGALGGRSQPF